MLGVRNLCWGYKTAHRVFRILVICAVRSNEALLPSTVRNFRAEDGWLENMNTSSGSLGGPTHKNRDPVQTFSCPYQGMNCSVYARTSMS